MIYYIYDNPKGLGSKQFIYRKTKNKDTFMMIKDLISTPYIEFTKGMIWTSTRLDDLLGNSRKLETHEIVAYKLKGIVFD